MKSDINLLSIKRRNGGIYVDASDNVVVAKVHITILDDAENVLEQGQDVSQGGQLWEIYISTAEEKSG